MNTRRASLGVPVVNGHRHRRRSLGAIDPALILALTEGAATATSIATQVAAARPEGGWRKDKKQEVEADVEAEAADTPPAPTRRPKRRKQPGVPGWLLPAGIAFAAVLGAIVVARRPS